jgi:hypothetical protein
MDYDDGKSCFVDLMVLLLMNDEASRGNGSIWQMARW